LRLHACNLYWTPIDDCLCARDKGHPTTVAQSLPLTRGGMEDSGELAGESHDGVATFNYMIWVEAFSRGKARVERATSD
jgi:hypothetical protein